jgi:hypothetical protein
MKEAIFAFAILLTLSGALGAAGAETNCNQVRRYAQTGRSAEDISETMIIPLEEVEKCLKGAGQSPAPTPPSKKE